MNIQRQKRTVFGKAVDVHICVLGGENWTNTEIPEVEVVAGVYEGTKFVALSVPVCQAPLQQRLPAGIVAIVAAVYTSINIEALIPVGRVRPPRGLCPHRHPLGSGSSTYEHRCRISPRLGNWGSCSRYRRSRLRS